MTNDTKNPFAGLDTSLLRSTAKPTSVVEKGEEIPQTIQPTPPLEVQKPIKKHVKIVKTKIGAYFTKEERTILKELEFKLNRDKEIIGQSDIIALAVVTLSKLLEKPISKLSSVEKIQDYIDSLLVKAKV